MEERKKYYKYCIVPSCKNNIKNAPKKVYFHVPRDAILRSIWFKAMNRTEELSPNTTLHCCEDHFNIEEDTENYMRYKVMSLQKGHSTTLRLKKGVIPHIFQSQKVKVLTSERMAALKRKALVDDAVYEYALKQNMFTAEKLGKSSSCHFPSRYITIFPMKTSETSNIQKKIFTGNPVDNVSSSSYLSPLSTDFEPDVHATVMDEDEINSNSFVNEITVIECRTCLHIMSPDAVLFNIFESWTPIQDGTTSTIAEDLENITNVKMQQSDRHSKVICRGCYELLHSACTFRALVRQNDQILQARLPQEQKIDNIWPKPIQVDKSISSSIQGNAADAEIKQEFLSDDEYNGADNICENGEDFANMEIKVEPEEMIQHQPSEQFVVNGSMSLNSFGADMTHLTNGTSGEHLLMKIKEEPLSEEETEATQTDLPLQCLLCTKEFHSVMGLKAHVIAQHSYKSVKRKNNNCVFPERNESNYVCAVCRRNFTTSTDLMVHETCHNRSVCYGCNEGFDTFEQLTKHRQTCKAIASQELKKPKTLDDVLRPQPPEDDSREIKCSHCEETFTDMYYVKIHQEIHHPTPDDCDMQVEMLENIFSDSSNS